MSEIDAAELRRCWSDKTNAVFSNSDRYDNRTYAAESFEREFDFKDCNNIVFMKGAGTAEKDMIMMTQGSGHLLLPPGVRVIMSGGYVKCNSERSVTDGSTAIGTGARAPPPSRVEGAYAHSSADSGYSGSVARGNTVDSYNMSPPRDAAAFMRGGPVASSYTSAAGIPPPRSTVGRSSGSSEWEVVGELQGYQDRTRDDCSIAPSESISSVGSRDNGGFTRRATHNF